jgi:hypothetical protein
MKMGENGIRLRVSREREYYINFHNLRQSESNNSEIGVNNERAEDLITRDW